jgi:hypothetical protein
MLTRVLIVAVVAVGLGGVSVAQPVAVPPPVTLFQNVRVFDGKGDTVSGPTNVLVRGTSSAHQRRDCPRGFIHGD